MSKTDETWVAAFPLEFKDQSESQFNGEQIVDLGMSLRDYFAARALQGLLVAHPEWGKDPHMNFAAMSYHLADAMMTEREK